MIKRIKKLFLNYIPAVAKTGVLSKAPFLYPFLEIKPSSCNLMLTNRCNLRCIMCNQWKSRLPTDELSTEEWKKVIAGLKKNGVKNIHYTGGEPLLRQDIAELVRYAVASGFTVGLTTNGLLLDKSLLDRLVKAGLRSIVISIDALGEGYDRVRGVANAFLKVVESARLISQAKKDHNIDASINFTLMNDTVGTFGDVLRFAEELRLPVAICLLDKNPYIFNVIENKTKFWIEKNNEFKIFLKLLRDTKIVNPSALIINFPSIDYISRYFDDPRQKEIPCVSSQDRVIIDPSGNFLGGCLAMGNFGNVKNVEIKELLNDARYREAKKRMFYKKCPGCSCGYIFNIRCMPALILKDIFYRTWYAMTRGGTR